MGLSALIAFGIFLILAAIAYRIAFPPETKIIETTKIEEKVIQPQKIIIQTPEGSRILERETSRGSNISNGSITELNKSNSNAASKGNIEIPREFNMSNGSIIELNDLKGDAASEASREIDQRLNDLNVFNIGSSVMTSLSWDNYNDLDLVVQEPNGNVIYFRKAF